MFYFLFFFLVFKGKTVFPSKHNFVCLLNVYIVFCSAFLSTFGSLSFNFLFSVFLLDSHIHLAITGICFIHSLHSRVGPPPSLKNANSAKSAPFHFAHFSKWEAPNAELPFGKVQLYIMFLQPKTEKTQVANKIHCFTVECHSQTATTRAI